jgi:hypothetical protein
VKSIHEQDPSIQNMMKIQTVGDGIWKEDIHLF